MIHGPWRDQMLAEAQHLYAAPEHALFKPHSWAPRCGRMAEYTTFCVALGNVQGKCTLVTPCTSPLHIRSDPEKEKPSSCVSRVCWSRDTRFIISEHILQSCSQRSGRASFSRRACIRCVQPHSPPTEPANRALEARCSARQV